MQASCTTFAQKALYIPDEWKVERSDTLLYSETDTENKYTWSKSRSKESENFICYWDKYYTTEPTNLSSNNYYYIDVDDLLKKAEIFYALNVGKLAFCDEASSKVSKYKMMILLNHTTTWTCYGGGYDFTIGALWLNPATCKPVGHSVAHEVGHSFQYMCYSDLGGHAGFHDPIGKGAAFWEQTAQWQAAQAYPSEKFSQSWSVFQNAHNYATTHEWQRYQSYWWHYYLAEKYGIDIIGKIWRHQIDYAADPNEVFMDMMGYDVKQLFKEYFDYAMKMATLDLDVCRDEASAYIGSYTYNYVSLGGTKYQVAYSSCPQSTGFNIIPLSVPQAGTTITTEFTSLKATALLADGDPVTYYSGNSIYESIEKTKYNSAQSYSARGFRLGYVALLKDGSRVYSSVDSIYCQGKRSTYSYSCETSYTVPENVDKLYMVVVPAPSTYIQHKWDDDVTNDDQWPYTVEFSNTNIAGAPVISEDLPISDATITYDVYFAPTTGGDYSGTTVTLTDDAAATLGTAFQMQASDLSGKMVSWSSAGPSDGQIMFYAVNANGNISNLGSSANGYGHWFNASGNRSDWGNGYLYSEFTPSTLTFNVGQYPGKLSAGSNYTISQALKYKRGDETATVKFVFNVHVTKEKTGSVLASTVQSDVVTAIEDINNRMEISTGPVNVYDISGRKVKGGTTEKDATKGLDKGVYIVGNKKVLIK